MTAGYHQTQERRLQLGIGQIVGGNVPPDVMDRDQGLVQRQRGGFGEIHAHQNRSDKTGRISHRHGVDVPAGQPGFLQRLIRKSVDGLDVLSGSNFRHHAAVDPMKLHPGGDAVRQNLTAVLYDGNSGLVAGGFNC